MNKNSGISNELCGSACATFMERWLPSPVAHGDLPLRPPYLLLDHIARILEDTSFCDVNRFYFNYVEGGKGRERETVFRYSRRPEVSAPLELQAVSCDPPLCGYSERNWTSLGHWGISPSP